MSIIIFRTEKGDDRTPDETLVAGQIKHATIEDVKDVTKKVTGEKPNTILKSGRNKIANTDNFKVYFIDKDDLKGGGMTSLFGGSHPELD